MIREVAEEAGVTIVVTSLAGVYSDPGHVLAYPDERGVYQQIAVCFHAISPDHDVHPDQDETIAAAWFDPEQATPLAMHPAMRQRLTNALAQPHPGRDPRRPDPPPTPGTLPAAGGDLLGRGE